MTDIRYTTTREPRWIALATRTCVLIVDRAVGADRVAELWTSVHDPAGSQAVLDALTRGGISTTPAFALATLPANLGAVPASVTLIVRGEAEVAVVTSGEAVRISGEGVSTWVERIVPDALGVSLGVRDAPGRRGAPIEFPLVEGSAPVGWIAIGNVTSVAESPAAAVVIAPASAMPAPIAAPSPVVETVVDPGLTISEPPAPDESTTSTPRDEVTAVGAESGYDFLFGETVVRAVEDAAIRDPKPDEPSAAGDHDGRTAVGLTPDERRAARRARQGAATPLAVVAPAFVLLFSSGIRELLDQPIVIGRAPSAIKVSANSVPRLLTVGGPDQDISRNHVQVSVEGGTVLVTDLHSRNGTLVTLPGRPPQQLRGGQPTAVIGGALVDLGSGITFTVGEQ